MNHKPDRQHLLGFSFIVVAALMVMQSIIIGHQQETEVQCQADYNAKVVAVQKQRAEWNDEDNRDLHSMARKLIDPKISQEEKSQAYRDWVETTQKNDLNRQAHPLPSRTSCG